MMSESVKIFLCYAREDETLRQGLVKQLSALKRQGLVDLWYDRDISAGTEWEREIDRHLNTAQIILLLISPDFMDSDYCYSIEMKRAMERHERGEARVIPVILRPVYWQGTPFGKLQALPTNANAVSLWGNRDEAFFNVSEGIRKAVQEWNARSFTYTSAAIDESSNNTTKEKVSSSSTPVLKQPIQFTAKRLRGSRTPLLILLIVAIATSGFIGLDVYSNYTKDRNNTPAIANAGATPQAQATAKFVSANSYPSYLSGHGNLALYDALDGISHNGWTTKSSSDSFCQFLQNKYHAGISAKNVVHPCMYPNHQFSKFAYEVQMTILKGDCGGLIIDANSDNSELYYYAVCQDGSYWLKKLDNHNPGWMFARSSNAAIKEGLNQLNQVAIVVDGNVITLYVNKQKITSFNDTSSLEGAIGLAAANFNNSTEVVYSNVRVWTL
jgi:hypothetical protein